MRRRALAELAGLAERDAVPLAPEAAVVNMHCHTSFSFNAYGHSPTSLVWLAKKRGFRALGSVDFDVLDGVDELLEAGDVLAVRTSTAIETRVYVPEFAQYETSSPGEPGIAYHMGIGFTTSRPPEAVAGILADLRQRSAGRNREMVARINAYLDPVAIDYERDVLPLTPSGNATERHALAAYTRAAARLPDVAGFWAGKLNLPREEIVALLADEPKLQNVIRARLMKRGGVGYVRPEAGAFPPVADFHRFVVQCGALPCVAWLDGTSTGEAAVEELLGFWLARGAAALNIIPDRNWNISDPEERRLKVHKLHEVVRLAQAWHLPLCVGTEMNSYGQKMVDDFAAPALAPLRQAFLDGAHFVYGHTALQRTLRLGYQSGWAEAHLPVRAERNAFYTQVGYRVRPGRAGLARLAELDAALSPSELLAQLA